MIVEEGGSGESYCQPIFELRLHLHCLTSDEVYHKVFGMDGRVGV